MAFALLMLGVAWLATVIATTAARLSNPWVGGLVMIGVVSPLTAGWLVWAFGPTPPWFRKFIARLEADA